MVGIWTAKFQMMAYHMMDDTSWLIRVRWWLLFSNKTMLNNSGVVTRTPAAEKATAKDLEVELLNVSSKKKTSLEREREFVLFNLQCCSETNFKNKFGIMQYGV